MEELALIDIWKDEQSVNSASQERRKEKRLGTHRCRRCCPGQRWCIRARRCSGWSPELWCNVTDGRGRRRLQPAAWTQQRPLTCLSWWWRLGKRVQGEGTFPYSTCLHTAVVKWKGPPAEGAWNPSTPAFSQHVWLWVCCLHVGRGVWQVGPDQPLPHTQENWLTSSTHVPPFRHGEEAHSLISDRKEEGWMAAVDFCKWPATAELRGNTVKLSSSPEGAGHNGDNEVIHRALWTTQRQNDL